MTLEFLRYGPVGDERPAVRTADGTAFALDRLTADLDGAFFERDGLDRAAEAVAVGDLAPLDLSGVRLGPPIARPAALVCIGLNYAAHAAESGAQAPRHPVVFLKHPGCIVGPNDDVVMPPNSDKSDWEVELAVVIKKTPRYLTSATQARDHIAGYVLSNDLSERTFQLELSGGQWSKGKCVETYNPLGPVLRPAGEVDPTDLRLRTWVNGELRQDSSTADLIFGVDELIVHLSQYMLLLPGDVISTGTPEGVALSGRFPYLAVDDTIAMEIDGLGRQEQRVVDASSAPCG
ncbi:fumarylacetoacetate hydrolase family protein [Desertimonas flava]|uniref:fumarylacetoacetate hydrolase family protein n=1 Tax=Desertimonas flava TaxID=2064846 RepID=UPI000E34A8FB|nr:fumarylacetoacetate hydrolase family protein [Desertimonas flava]